MIIKADLKPIPNDQVAKKTGFSTPALGVPLGFIDVPASIAASAAQVADAFWESQTASDFNEQVDSCSSASMPQDWIPHAQLNAIGYKVDLKRQHLVMTTGVDMHIDNDMGATLLWVLANDGMTFRQNKSRSILEPGQWIIFNDRIAHGVDLKKASSKKAVFVGWVVKLLPI